MSSKQTSRFRAALFRSAGFSLVEVTLAIGIAAFVIIPIVALLPVGLRSASNANNESRAVNLLNAIANDRMATPLPQSSLQFDLPPLLPLLSQPTAGEFGIRDNDEVVNPANMASALFRVNYRIIPPPPGTKYPYHLHLRISWPAQNPSSTDFIEVLDTIPLH